MSKNTQPSLPPAMEENKENDKPSPMTQDDRKIKAALDIRSCSQQIQDIAHVSKEAAAVLSSDKATKLARTRALRDLTVVLPRVCGDATMALLNDAKTLNPIPSLNYAYKREEAKRKKLESKETNIKPGDANTSSPIARLRFLSAIKPTKLFTNPPRRPSKRTKVARQLPFHNRPSQELNIITPPKSGRSIYSKRELFDICSPLKGSQRSKQIDQLVNQKLIPVQRNQCYKILRAVEVNGEKPPSEDELWSNVGRPPLLDHSNLKAITDDLKRLSGKTVGPEEIRAAIIEKKKKTILEKGLVPLGAMDENVNRATIRNYLAVQAVQEGCSVTHRCISKTQTRYTAENSWISSTIFMMVVAATHFIILSQSSREYTEQQKRLTLASPGAKKLYRLVEKVNAFAPIYVVKIHLVFSTDDTVVFTHEGVSKKEGKFRLVGTRAINKSGARSRYSGDQSHTMKGLRVKLTFTFSGAGMMADVFVSVCGLSETELPRETCPSGILALEIKGLCIGGGGVSVGNEKTGWVVCIRNDHDKAADKQRYKFYRDKVLIPFVRQLRGHYDGWQERTPIPDELSAVSWCDGDLAQIATIIEQDALDVYRDEKICANKQNAARSGTKQAADLTHTFKLMHKLQQTVSVSHLPPDHHPFKRIIAAAFHKLEAEGKLRLGHTRKYAVIDFISCVPEMLTVAATARNVQEGYFQNGMADHPGAEQFPDRDMMLATCRRQPEQYEYDLTEKKFDELFQQQINFGHIPDSMMEGMGFPMDTDMDGKEVRRDATIRQESRQRAKCLTHNHQVTQRQIQFQNLQKEKQSKDALEYNKIHHHLKTNKACEQKLLELLTEKRKEKPKRKPKQGLAGVNSVPATALVPPEAGELLVTHQDDVSQVVTPQPKPCVPLVGGLSPSKAQHNDTPINDSPFNPCTLEHFMKVKSDLLKSFFFVRKFDKLQQYTFPKKGTVEDEIEKKDAFLLGRAFNIRNSQVILADSPTCQPSQPQDERYKNATIIQLGPSRGGFVATGFILASELLSKPEWIAKFHFCFCPESRPQEKICENIMQQANSLQSMLLSRLTSHINARVEDKKKHTHWIWNWAASNFGMMTAIMVLSNHVKKNVNYLDSTKCLLTTPNNFAPATNDLASQEGCYLHYDTNDGEWVRSGKVTNRSFATRNKEHATGAKLTTENDLKSKFYTSYPSTSANIASQCIRKGCFEDLVQYVGVGFDRKEGVIPLLTSSFDDDGGGGGVFLFDGAVKARIAKVNFRGVTSLDNKQLRVIGYLLECAYDLALSPNYNISKSPGFETILGVFGGSSTTS